MSGFDVFLGLIAVAAAGAVVTLPSRVEAGRRAAAQRTTAAVALICGALLQVVALGTLSPMLYVSGAILLAGSVVVFSRSTHRPVLVALAFLVVGVVAWVGLRSVDAQDLRPDLDLAGRRDAMGRKVESHGDGSVRFVLWSNRRHEDLTRFAADLEVSDPDFSVGLGNYSGDGRAASVAAVDRVLQETGVSQFLVAGPEELAGGEAPVAHDTYFGTGRVVLSPRPYLAVLLLDSSTGRLGADQLDWMEDWLETERAAYRYAVIGLHHQVIEFVPHVDGAHLEEEGERERFLDLCERHHVNLVASAAIAGHAASRRGETTFVAAGGPPRDGAETVIWVDADPFELKVRALEHRTDAPLIASAAGPRWTLTSLMNRSRGLAGACLGGTTAVLAWPLVLLSGWLLTRGRRKNGPDQGAY